MGIRGMLVHDTIVTIITILSKLVVLEFKNLLICREYLRDIRIRSLAIPS